MDCQSEEAFEEYVLGRQAALFRAAFLLTGDRGHAEDLLQSALERTYQHWRRVAAAASPDAYVRRIMINLANDRWRARRYVAEQGLDSALAAVSERDRQVEQAESRDLVVRALRTVPPRMRTVLVLRAAARPTRREPVLDRPGAALANVRDFYAKYPAAARHGRRAASAVIRAHAASWYAPIISGQPSAGFGPPGCGIPYRAVGLRYQVAGVLGGQDVIVARWHVSAGQPLFAVVIAAVRSGQLTGISCIPGGNVVSGSAARIAAADLFGRYLAARRSGMSARAGLASLISGGSSAAAIQYVPQAITALSARAVEYDPVLCTTSGLPSVSFGSAEIVADGSAGLIVVRPRHARPIVVVAILGAQGWIVADIACQRP